MSGGVLQATWTTFRRLLLVPMLVAALSLLSWAAHAAGDSQCPDIRKGVCQPDATLLTSLPLNETELCCTACAQVKDCVGFTLNEQYCYLHSDWVEEVKSDRCTSGKIRDAPEPPADKPLNVLLIIVDDLRPQFHDVYDQKVMITPNIDRLMAEGTTFRRAYCQQAICGPTRNSFLSGRRPQRTESWNFINHFRQVGPDWISFPQYFKSFNYTTLGTGKTYHPNLPPNWDTPFSWSSVRPYVSSGNSYPQCTRSDSKPSSSVCPIDANVSTFGDAKNAEAAIEDLEFDAAQPNPFFVVFGAHRPHLPWNVPQKFWDMYPATEDIALPKHEEAPKGMPPIAFTYEMDGKVNLTSFNDECPIPFPDGSTRAPDNMTRSLRKGYYAAVSFTDSLIGELLDKLEALGKKDDTVVALIGDHGWQLGEHNIWGKHTNFELGTHVPLVIRKPGVAPSTTTALVESVDLYPTIASLAGLPPPQDIDGVDISSLMQPGAKPLKTAVFSEYPRCPSNISEPWSDRTSCVHTPRDKFAVMGYSVRTDTWRFTVWLLWDGVNLVGNFSAPPVGVELYPHGADADKENDFDFYENENVADQNPDVVAQMMNVAKNHWGKKTFTPEQRAQAAARWAALEAHYPASDPASEAVQYEQWWRVEE